MPSIGNSSDAKQPEAMPLNRMQLQLLTDLVRADGSGTLNAYGHVVVGPTKHPLAGDPVNWLVLVSHGMISGEHGKIIATEAGRNAVSKAVDGYSTRRA